MNPPVATPFFFYLLAATMIVGGILVITRKNAVHSAMALITTLLAQAGLYLMLYAPFVAGVQIILYAGGIMVLFLFVIMLCKPRRHSVGCSSRFTRPRQKARCCFPKGV
jgi:NADH-quinone oxidoreductase subunit J